MRNLVRTAGAVCLACVLRSGGAHSQDQDAKPWFEHVTVNAFVSSGLTFNANRPDSGINSFRVFDSRDLTFQADVFELSVRKDAGAIPGSTGFRADIAAGSSIPRVSRSAGLEAGDIDLQQAYATYVAPVGGGLRLDAGKFVTPLGYEVIEGYDGFNEHASRSFLFGYAIPFTHTGVRATYAFGGTSTATILATNGWDNAVDNNRGKSIGAQLALTPAEGAAVLIGGITGPERSSNSRDRRTVVDLVATTTVLPGLALGVNVDLGREEHATAGGSTAQWNGLAVYLRWRCCERFALSLRGEQFEDLDGARTSVPQILREATLTPELRVDEHILLRSDLRIDWSSSPVFQKRGEWVKIQPTFSLSVLCVY